MSYVLVEYIKCTDCGTPLEAIILEENYVSLTYQARECSCGKVTFRVDKSTGETTPNVERISIEEYIRFWEKKRRRVT